MNISGHTVVLLLVALFLWSFCPAGESPFGGCHAAWAAGGDGAHVRALVERDSVSVGEPFVLQIRVEGSEMASGTASPDMSGLADFAVESLGGQSNNSSSITIINGKMNKVESYGYVYSYRLTAKKAGKFEIPSIPVPVDAAGSQILRTEPIAVRVTEPETSDDFHLELKFSKTNFFVGEPVLLTVVWYIGRDVDNANFDLPILQEPAFTFTDPKMDTNPGRQLVQIPMGGAVVTAEKGTGVYNGRTYTTLSFCKVLFAKRSGRVEVPEGTVSCRALVGYANSQKRRSPLDGSFDDDFFNPGRRSVTKIFVARSQPAVLTALALPDAGKPADFSGLVGHFKVETSAEPTDVSVGDPITLTVSVSGPEYLENMELPPLARDVDLQKDFKIPDEMAAGILRGRAKEFTQTLRAKAPDVTAIPSVKLSYFDPDTGRYEVARSKPIALSVKPAKVLTSADVEGRAEGVSVKKSELETWSRGIATNYEGPEVLEKKDYRIGSVVRSPLWLATTFIPFFSFIVLLVLTHVRQRQMADPGGLRSRKAFSGFKQRVQPIQAGNPDAGDGYALLLDAVRGYLGDKLRKNGSALTFFDVEEDLKGRGVDLALAERLKALFETCEQGSYGGMGSGRPMDELTREALDLIGSLDRII